MSVVEPVKETNIPGLSLVHRGKVRDVYQVGENEFLLVATDRISAFDCVFPTPVPRKGFVLTALSKFWFSRLANITKHHLITDDVDEMLLPASETKKLRGRSMLVRKTVVFPVECVVRGYLAGSGWKDYLQTGEVCGHKLPAGMLEAERLPQPIFTPATKAQTGHDENIGESELVNIIGAEYAERLRSLSIRIYDEASRYALTRGIIIADTKFEFGMDNDGEILLIDEVLTPDSSRFWAPETYKPGSSPPSFDKQFVRDYVESLKWDKRPPAPPLPDEIVRATTERYLKAYELLTGEELRIN